MNVMRFAVQVSVLFAILGVAVFGCGGRQPGGDDEQDTENIGPIRLVDSPTPSDLPGRRPFEGPPHRFTPRAHTPKHRYTSNPTPDIRAFPKLVMRMGRCFGREREQAAPIASSPKRKAGRPKSSAGKGGGKRRRAKTAAGSGASRKKASAPAEMSGADLFGSPAAKEDAKVAEAPPPPAAAEETSVEAEAAADEAPAPASAPLSQPSMPPIDPDAAYTDWGQAVYLSNDDTMSLSSAQRVIYAIDNFLPLPAEHIRPHELLNYFSFNTQQVTDGHDFSILGDIAADPLEPGIYTLGLAVKGRPVDKTSRRNAVLTLVIDRSGSMSDEGRMNYLKQGLRRMLQELKTGDMLHLVLFDHDVCVPAENFVVGRDDIRQLERVIDALEPRGSTDLHAGLSEGYRIADRSYRDTSTNRVVMITDALTNTGVTDEQMISIISKYYDSRRIRLSGIGVGRDFNDSLLDRLTEKGKGAYVFLGSAAEVDAVFGPRFISLIETTALDVHFRLHLPPSLRMNVFYGEESSTVKADVQEIHYFANTSQLFLSDLMARGGALRPQDDIMLTIEYKDPETETPMVEETAFPLSDLMSDPFNVRKAKVIMTFIDMLTVMAARPTPSAYGRDVGSWQDAEGWAQCEEGRTELAKRSEPVADDPEITRVNQLFEKYCARFDRPRNPVRRRIVPPEPGWPGASPTPIR